MYRSSTSMRSPGRMLPTRMLKTLGRDCSRSEALLPSLTALVKVALASSRSLIFATTRWSPTVMVMPCTAARVDPGKTYLAWMGREPRFT